MIQMENVTYSYEKGYGIKNVNFTIDDSEFTFLIGPTGSGKTTIMKLIYMALFPQSGVVTTGKFSSDKIKKRKIPFLRRKIGMIFQDYHLLQDRNLYENIALPLYVVGTSHSDVSERVEEAIDQVSLTGKEEHLPNELSGGEQQRACIARALVKEPEIILADEPTGNLDPITSFELLKLLESVNHEGTAVLMASHNYNLIKGRGHRIMEIQQGILRNN
ncbi:MAG: cell division ATP-binding protein FtsE [Candidatus Marinimicrobia bacterium]|jgi:cell division transport system ATP-binding protein|uniref:ABC transporter domain-containing protein n=1 Tax=marine metagenome TaxID=408172 RepID=A0A381TUM1_9ZZZZ|nr:cell division ATP-binding protein FtsE [Candidatus Neomarinimicrobiota bacterium]MBI66538.1 cell division ATP-binding protein FtsE [Candidatus Neomarinimicrobiota bacterium]|tara:strand:+ start:166 stop:819 length:654 start_codon:yes stop_codon:yes gene_type:complete